MSKCMFVTHNNVNNVIVNFGIHTNCENHVNNILNGEPTIVGACPEEDLIVIGNKHNQSDNSNTIENTNKYLDKFNKDVIKGDVIIMKTNTRGEPIDYLP